MVSTVGILIFGFFKFWIQESSGPAFESRLSILYNASFTGDPEPEPFFDPENPSPLTIYPSNFLPNSPTRSSCRRTLFVLAAILKLSRVPLCSQNYDLVRRARVHKSVLHTDALITVVAPSIGLRPQTKKSIELRKDRITYVDHTVQTVEDLELEEIHMVLTALDAKGCR